MLALKGKTQRRCLQIISPSFNKIFAKFSRRHVLCMGLILLVCIGFFSIFGLETLPSTQAIYRREIVQAHSDVPTPPLKQGQVLKQMIFVEGELHGISLRPATQEKQLNGTLQVELMEHFETATIFSTSIPLNILQENQPLDIPFGGMVDASANGGEYNNGTWYCIRITANPITPEDAPSFYKSNGYPQYYVDPNVGMDHYSNFDGFPIDTGDGWVREMLAMEYFTDVSGGFLQEPYCFFAAFLSLLVLLAYAFIFVFKRPLHQIFALCALGLGFVFIFLIPPRAAPDEYAHISTAYHYANRLLGVGAEDEFGKLWVRKGDEMKLWNYDTTSIDIFAYKDLHKNLFASAEKGQGMYIPARSPTVFPFQLGVPAMGVFFARILGLGRIGMLVFGRLFNLCFYSLMLSLAIKRLPFAKPLLFCVGLLPMCLQLAASFSYDTYVISLSFYLAACCINYRYTNKKMALPQCFLLFCLCVFLAPAKAVYISLILLVFLVRPAQFVNKKTCYAFRSLTLTAALALWFSFTSSSIAVSVGGGANIALAAGQSPLSMHSAVNATKLAALPANTAFYKQKQAIALASHTALPANGRETNWSHEYKGELAANGDAVQLYDAHYILQHVPESIAMVLRTFWLQSPLWLQGALGGRLGEVIAVNIQLNWALVATLCMLLCLSSICQPKDRRTLKPKHRLMFFGISIFCMLAAILAGLTWTPVNYYCIFGIQGRYILPVLPLFLFAARGRKVWFTRPVWQVLAFAQVIVLVLCQINAFSIILQLPV